MSPCTVNLNLLAGIALVFKTLTFSIIKACTDKCVGLVVVYAKDHLILLLEIHVNSLRSAIQRT